MVRAVKSIVKQENGKKIANIRDIAIEKRAEGAIEDTELIAGIIENTKIAILSAPIEVRKSETKSEISIELPGQTRMFLEQEEKLIRQAAEKVIKSGANVVFCQKGVDELARYFLAKAGIFVAHRVKKDDLEKLSRATGGKLITSLDEITPEALGFAGRVEEKMIGLSEMIFVTQCKNPSTFNTIAGRN